jgi:hypothetical protein
MYTSLTIWNLEQPLRDCLRYADPERKIPLVFFHRESDGTHIQSMAGMRYSAHSLFAIGETHSELLQENTALLVKLLKAKFPQITFNLKTGPCSLSVGNELKLYKSQHCVISGSRGKRRSLFDHWKGELTAEQKEYLTDMIKRALHRQQAGMLNSDFPEEEIIIGDMKANACSPLPMKNGGHYRSRANITFKSNIQIQGPWHCGGVTHKGNGKIIVVPTGENS